ncbi:unnamed protein product [Sphagnum jensenii]|uniref:Uncharacterized protein n=1 Tax=Sphagnum jensenii TaxID=128206 RepID=A0ABP1AM68_9BRYO
MTTARAFISSWVVPQLSSGSKRNNLGFGKLGFMRRASPCPYPRATLARSIITWWRSPAGRFNCSPQSLRLDIIMGALSNGAGTTETWHESKEHVVDITEFALEGAKITSVAHGTKTPLAQKHITHWNILLFIFHIFYMVERGGKKVNGFSL